MPDAESFDTGPCTLDDLRNWLALSPGAWSRFDPDVFEGLPDQIDRLEHERLRGGRPFICDFGGFRSLHFCSFHVQSQMDIRRPLHLMTDYTRMMMGFLVFQSAPGSIEMIGLGGGSLAKYCHHTLPDAQISIAEIDSDVIALRDRFHIPADSARFRVIQEDGADFVRHHPGTPDILMVDGFDRCGQPPQLCSISFYEACCERLAQGGLMVVNLSGSRAEQRTITRRIADTFGGHVLSVATEGAGNRTVFAGKGWCPTLTEETLAGALQLRDLDQHPFLAAIGRRMLRASRLAERRHKTDREAKELKEGSPLPGRDQPMASSHDNVHGQAVSSLHQARELNLLTEARAGRSGRQVMDGKQPC